VVWKQAESVETSMVVVPGVSAVKVARMAAVADGYPPVYDVMARVVPWSMGIAQLPADPGRSCTVRL